MAQCVGLWCAAIWGAALLGTATPAISADAPAPPKIVSMADALKALPASRLPDGAIILTVGPERVLPPPPADAADLGTLEGVSSAYNRSQQVFGRVIALAPPTMVTLNTDPSLADVPLADLVQQNPLPFLLGTLTQGQLALLGTKGLGMADLDPDQQSLFLASLPHPFRVVPATAALPSLTEEQVKAWTTADWKNWQAKGEAMKAQTVTLSENDLRGVRLLAHKTADYVLDVPGQSGYGIGVSPGGPSRPDGAGPYTLTNYGDPVEDQHGKLQSYFRAEMPNELKDGDLRWTQRALDVPVALDGLNTVGDLVARLSKTTGLELHCDPHYARQSLLILGATGKPRGADEVTQALTLCVCGAWRQVGPGWVLTDDVQGVASRRAMLKDIAAVWGTRLDKAAKAVGDHLGEAGWTQALSFAPGDPDALPPPLAAKVDAQNGKSRGFGVPLAWKDLPPAMRTGMRRGMDDPEFRRNEGASAVKVEAKLGPDTPVYVELNMRLTVAVPGYGTLPLMLNNEYRVPHSNPPHAPPPGAPAKPAPVVLTEKTRGLLCAPVSADQARQVVDRMAAMGFNALFCDVFTRGRAYFPNAALPPASAEAGGVLAAAIAEGRKKGVAVYAVLDTLCWRKDGPNSRQPALPAGFTEDLTLQSETTSDDIHRRLAAGSLGEYATEEEVLPRLGVQRWVSPADPQLRATLPALVKTLAATPGLAGLVFQDTAAPGYLGGGDTGDYEASGLGYTLPNRLARLRAGEADPVDVGGGRDTWVSFRSQEANVSATLDVSLPSLDDGELTLSRTWDQFRADADRALLADLYAAARGAAPRMPLLMRERRIGFTLDPWTDSNQLNEVTDLRSEGNALGKHATPATILVIPHALPEENGLAGGIRELEQEIGNGVAGGILLDLLDITPGPSSLLKRLDQLVPYFSATP